MSWFHDNEVEQWYLSETNKPPSNQRPSISRKPLHYRKKTAKYEVQTIDPYYGYNY